MQDRFQSRSKDSAVPIRPSRFASEIEQIFGDDLDLDPRFLEDCWTLGIPAALEILNRRRRTQSECESQHRAFRELDSFASLNFISDSKPAAESVLSNRSAAIASHYAASSSQHAPHLASASDQKTPPPAWIPQDWKRQDRIKQSWIPQGWLPPDTPRLEPSPEPPPSSEPCDNGTTRARQLLGVTPTSSREEIRSAYRRGVRLCHPDGLQHATEPVRQRATRQLAAFNEAYRLLCASLV